MPKLLICPRCGHNRSWSIRRNHRKCKKCRKEWSTGNQFPISGFRLSCKDWQKIISAFLKFETINSVAEECRLSYVTAHKAVKFLRTMMTADQPTFSYGICEMDETYIGGAWKNKAIHIRRQGSARGRGTLKQEIFGIVSRNLKKVAVWLVPNGKRKTIFPIVKKHVVMGSIIFTDGFKIYRRLPVLGYIHQWVDHDAGEYVRGIVHTQTIDGFWGLLKTHLDSIGGIRKSEAKFYVGEYVWRYNNRDLNTKEQVKKLINECM